jgi:quinol monooxygenase YgiN
MLLVAARCHVLPDHCRDFVHQVSRIIPRVRAEPGCSRYELHADAFEEGLFIFHEEWESQTHLDNHIGSPHMRDHFATCAAWMAAPTGLTVYEVSSLRTVVL